MKTSTSRHNMWIYLHTSFIIAWTLVSTFVMGLVAILASFFSKSGDMVHHVAQVWGKSILWVSGIRVKTSGLDIKGEVQSFIFMSNHESNFDIPVLLSALPVQFRWLAKAELFKIPIFGRSMRGAGYISIDRSNRKSAFTSLRRAAEMIRCGTSVLIFPEGTRSLDGSLQPFKKGGFVLAVDAGVPIIPVVISGTHDIMPKGRLLIRRRKVYVEVRDPIPSGEYTRKTKDDLMARVRAAMLEAPSVTVEEEGGRG